jgi:hypothetical protein
MSYQIKKRFNYDVGSYSNSKRQTCLAIEQTTEGKETSAAQKEVQIPRFRKSRLEEN